MRNSFLVSSLSRLSVSLLCAALAVVDLDCTATACAQQPAATHGMTMPAAAIAPQDLPPPIAMSGIGNSHLQITTSNPQAQVWFNQGLNLLHDFWDYESSRAFEQSVRLDPNCAMCYWGVYQAESFRGEDKTWHRVALKQAARLAKHASPQEKLYIRAAQQEQKEQDRKPSRSSRLFVGNSRKAAHSDSSQSPHIDSPETVTLRKLVALSPHDTQARIFLAESLMDGFDKKSNPKSGTVQGQAILSSILAAHPDDSAANHYWIHAVEPGLHPELALDSAAKLGSLAPSSGHMVHMPGHIYYRLGDYETARASFLNSEHTDESYMRDQHVAADDDWNYVHNLMYLIADLLEAGQIQEATAVSSRLNTARGSRGATLYLGSPRDGITRLDLDLPVALRSADWPRVIAMLKRSSPPADLPNLASLRTSLLDYAQGMQALQDKKVSAAAGYSSDLDARIAAKPPADADDMPSMPGMPPSKDATAGPLHSFLNVAALELQASVLLAEHKAVESDAAFTKAATAEKELGYREPPGYIRPVGEARGDALMRAGDYTAAKTAYQAALAERPNSGYPLFGIAQADQAADHIAAATADYEALVKAWSRADADLPQLDTARGWLAQHPTLASNGK